MRGLAFMGCAALLTISAPAFSQGDSSSPQQPAVSDAIQPEAVDALKRMSQYLSTLQSFQLAVNSTLDVVTVDDQRLQVGAVVKYKVKKPGIAIDFDTDMMDRKYFYDGKTFTIYSPGLNFYASSSAPSTNREFLKAIYDKFGISLPLEDLFRWNDGDTSDLQALTSGFSVGTATVDGIPTNHWAFRQGDFDWEVWIEQGDRPLPRKLVIVDRTDPARPAYNARLDWTLNPAIPAADFTFVPDKNASRIPLAVLTEGAQ